MNSNEKNQTILWSDFFQREERKIYLVKWSSSGKVKDQPCSRLDLRLAYTGCADDDVRHRTWRVLIDVLMSSRPALFYSIRIYRLPFLFWKQHKDQQSGHQYLKYLVSVISNRSRLSNQNVTPKNRKQ